MTVDKFAKHLAEKKEDSRLWTPLDALEELVEQIRAGEINPDNLIVHYWAKSEDGSLNPGYICAGVTFPDHLAMLDVAKTILLREWVQDK